MDDNLKKTLIIPPDEGSAGQLFQNALNDLDVVLFVVLGKDRKDLIKLVDWRARADQSRQAVWIWDPSLPSLSAAIQKMQGGDPSVFAAVYSRTDKVVLRIKEGDPTEPLDLEIAFSQGDAAL